MLKTIIQQDLNSAVKNKEELKSSVLRMFLAALLNKEKEKKFKLKEEKEAQLIDEEIIEAIYSEIKKRKEAKELYFRGGRFDLAEKEEKEVEILQKYLPEQLSEEEIRKLAQEIIKKVGAKEIKDIGKIMSELMPLIKNRADGSIASKIVKELL